MKLYTDLWKKKIETLENKSWAVRKKIIFLF